MRVSEIRVKRIRVNQGLGVIYYLIFLPLIISELFDSLDNLC